MPPLFRANMVYTIVLFIIHIHLDLSKCINREGPLTHNGDSIHGLPHPALTRLLMAVVLVYKAMWVHYKTALQTIQSAPLFSHRMFAYKSCLLKHP